MLDIVNKMQWKKCTFSFNSEYIIGGILPHLPFFILYFINNYIGSAQKSSHNIYIWSQSGALIKNLEGPKEGIMDLEVSLFHFSFLSLPLFLFLNCFLAPFRRTF